MRRTSLPAHESAGPGEPGAEGRHRDELPGLDYGDTGNNGFWDPKLGKYVAFTRH